MKLLVTTTSFQDTPGNHHKYLKKLNFDVDFLRGPLKEAKLLDIIHKYDGIICGDDQYSSKVLQLGKQNKLKFISKYGIGLDSIDLETAKKLNIKISNCPGINKVSVAEHVLALLLTFEKNIHLQYQTTKEAKWDRMIGNEINGKVMGIIGYGAIGSELAKKSLGLGLKVIIYDKFKNLDKINNGQKIYSVKNIDILYEKSDIISLHVPLNEYTKNLINYEVVSTKLKNRPLIINTSRGQIVDNKSIIFALENNLIRGYLTDVLNEEPITKNEILLNKKNIIITPHIASRTFQSVEKQAIMAIDNLIEMIKIYDK